MSRRNAARAAALCAVCICFGAAAVWSGRSAARGEAQQGDNREVAEMYRADQADRSPAGANAIDWNAVGPRDRQREARIKELYEHDALRTGRDYANAAMILQHAQKPDDFLLAHELCVAALVKGFRDARWLAAATEDRFLMNIGRPQRFGTQYRGDNGEPVRLYQTGSGVTDSLRAVYKVPSLEDARKREAEMDAVLRGKQR